MSRIDYGSVRVCKQTGRRYLVNGVRKWRKMYYSCDGFETQATSVAEAKARALAAGTLSWLPEKAET